MRRLLIAFDEIAQETLNPGEERFGAFLALLLAQLRTQLRAEGEDPLAATIRRYLAEHLDQRINLADISKAVSFSPSHCQSVFRKATGRSIIDTLLGMRMKKARELISSGEFSLQDIAAMVGFEDYNYFSRQFRARSGNVTGIRPKGDCVCYFEGLEGHTFRANSIQKRPLRDRRGRFSLIVQSEKAF